MNRQLDMKKQVEEFHNQLDSSATEVFDFFICFSKFECALKQAGYYHWNERHKKLSPDWKTFTKDIASEFDKDSERRERILDEAIKYFQDHPPQKQTRKEGQVDWKDVPYDNGPLLEWLVDAIKRVRNNLFHGGKYPYSDLQEPARNPSLLNYSLTILQESLALCGSEKLSEVVRNKTQRVRESFEEPI